VSDIEKLLLGDEEVFAVSREHGVVLARPFLRTLGAILILGFLAYEIARFAALGSGRAVFAIGFGLLAAWALVVLVRQVSRWHQRRLVITDRRLILVEGNFARKVAVLPLSAVEEVEARQTGAGRRFHYGHLLITTSGRRMSLFGLRHLPDPDLHMALVLGLDERISPRRAPRGSRRLSVRVPVSAG
jgi:membrane protein YdbS with pleckstrin-like domain